MRHCAAFGAIARSALDGVAARGSQGGVNGGRGGLSDFEEFRRAPLRPNVIEGHVVGRCRLPLSNPR